MVYELERYLLVTTVVVAQHSNPDGADGPNDKPKDKQATVEDERDAESEVQRDSAVVDDELRFEGVEKGKGKEKGGEW